MLYEVITDQYHCFTLFNRADKSESHQIWSDHPGDNVRDFQVHLGVPDTGDVAYLRGTLKPVPQHTFLLQLICMNLHYIHRCLAALFVVLCSIAIICFPVAAQGNDAASNPLGVLPFLGGLGSSSEPVRITSYNVCYTKLLRCVISLCCYGKTDDRYAAEHNELV